MTMWHFMFGLLVMTPLMAALDSHGGNGTWTGFFLGAFAGVLIGVLNAVLMLYSVSFYNQWHAKRKEKQTSSGLSPEAVWNMYFIFMFPWLLASTLLVLTFKQILISAVFGH